MDQDPIHQFFSSTEADTDNVLYLALSLEPNASQAEITKAYRKLALLHHPDKHAGKDEAEREEESKLFQRVGFAYGVLKDEGRRKRYDSTGQTSEAAFLEEGEEMGWEAYFEHVFEEVTRQKLDELKKEYQHSEEERQDLLSAYISHSGSLPLILSYIPHSTASADETRFIEIINAAIKAKTLKTFPEWKKSCGDEKARRERLKEEEEEGGEAEKAAKELGVWEEFFGDGKKGERKGKGKGKDKGKKEPEEEDTSSLQALIKRNAAKRAGQATSFLDNLASKYAEPSSSKSKAGAKGKGKGKAATAESTGKGKAAKRKSVEEDDDGEGEDGWSIGTGGEEEEKDDASKGTEEIDDETFARLQAEMDARRAAKPTPTATSGTTTSKKAAKTKAPPKKKAKVERSNPTAGEGDEKRKTGRK